MSDRHPSLGAYTVLVCAVCAVYANALRATFQFDDYNVIVGNPVVHSWPAWWADVGHGIRPLLKAAYTLNWTLGPDAFGFHLVNVLVHAANTLLIYVFSRKLFGASRLTPDALRINPQTPHPSPLTHPAALVAALLFAVHPVQTEAVTYITGRSVSLMALCYLGSLLAYVQARDASGRQRGWLSALSLVLFILAVAVKEIAVTLPAALLLWEWAAGGRPPWRVVLRRQAWHWLLLGAAAGWLLWHPGYRALLAYSLAVRSLHDAVLTQIHGIAYLLSRLVWIHHLNIDPDLPVLTGWTPGLIAEFLALAAGVVVGMGCLRRYPWAGFGILWVCLHLLPTNSVVPRLDVANERQLYLAGWGVFLLVGGGLASLWRIAPRPVMAVSVALVIWLGTATVQRNEAYQTEVSLWEATVRESPAKPRAYNNLGYAYALAGRPQEAEAAYQAALRLSPDFTLARQNLALLGHPLTPYP
jgi:tetratricopeptide (TPR) repeat protein